MSSHTTTIPHIGDIDVTRRWGQQVNAWKRNLYQYVTAEISSLARYMDRMYQLEPMPHDSGTIYQGIKCDEKHIAHSIDELPDVSADSEQTDLILLNSNLNYSHNIQQQLQDLKPKLNRRSRIAVINYNPYFSGLYHWANRLGLRSADVPETFVTSRDLRTIGKLCGYEIVKHRPCGYVPFNGLGLGKLFNRFMAATPLARWAGYMAVTILRPVKACEAKPSLSVVIPARNEMGNIENALKRMPELGNEIEIIFVEGNSTDDTWGEIQRVSDQYQHQYKIACYQQPGKGKNDAVRLGFSKATGDLVTILDADLTMPPEMLSWFYNAYCDGHGDFINGNRLLYPMEGEAMRFLNRLGNIFFGKALSHVLGIQIGDSLCGTKLFARRDKDRIVQWRGDFGDFDPFGDFEMLFGASELCLGVTDVPIRYAARTYGSTNISRFRDGWTLLKMTFTGMRRIRMGKA